jgi:hypothetical protein
MTSRTGRLGCVVSAGARTVVTTFVAVRSSTGSSGPYSEGSSITGSGAGPKTGLGIGPGGRSIGAAVCKGPGVICGS